MSALEKALGKGVVPDIFNSDQGCQFTSEAFTSRLTEKGFLRLFLLKLFQSLKAAEVQISWDGRRRFWDNIFIERLWRSVKYEEA